MKEVEVLEVLKVEVEEVGCCYICPVSVSAQPGSQSAVQPVI